MNSNIVIILYLLFLLVICSNKPVLVEGAMFSSSNCSNVQGILNQLSTGHTNCVNDPTIGINCNILSGLHDLVQNEYNEVCSQQPNTQPNTPQLTCPQECSTPPTWPAICETSLFQHCIDPNVDSSGGLSCPDVCITPPTYPPICYTPSFSHCLS